MTETLIQLDGSLGEGGGQILRSALAMSLATGRGFRLRNVRAKLRDAGYDCIVTVHGVGYRLGSPG